MKNVVSFSLMFFLLFLMATTPCRSQSKSLAESLGYPADAKLLIIHADDIGVSHSENAASWEAMQKGPVNSGSIMVPCPWFAEVAAYAHRHPGLDLGLHLTLTSEWKHYKWGPAAAAANVPSLVDESGFLYDNCADFNQNARLEEVEMELKVQIERAIAFGIQPTHLDSHMGCLFFYTPELFALYLKMGREYKIPVMISRDFLKEQRPDLAGLITEKDIVVDRAFTANESDYAKGMESYYTEVIKGLEPGVSVLLIHLAFDNAEMQAVTIDHPAWGAAWRQADFDFFTGDKCKKLLSDNNIRLISWKELGKLIK